MTRRNTRPKWFAHPFRMRMHRRHLQLAARQIWEIYVRCTDL